MTESPDRDHRNDQTDAEEFEQEPAPVPPGAEWRLWPPSPKMQIVLIAVGFGLFNLMLIGIWAWVMVREFG